MRSSSPSGAATRRSVRSCDSLTRPGSRRPHSRPHGRLSTTFSSATPAVRGATRRLISLIAEKDRHHAARRLHRPHPIDHPGAPQSVWVVVTLVQPLFYLLFYAPLLKRTIGSDRLDGGSAYDIFVRGLLMQLALFGTAFAGFGLVSELREGVIERRLVTPVRRSALLIGRVLANLVALVFQATVITLVSWLMGLNLRPSAILGVLVLLVVGIIFASLSHTVSMILGRKTGDVPGASCRGRSRRSRAVEP